MDGDDNLLFVNLIEELKDILEKSQVPSARIKKDNAATVFIERWKQLSGKELSQASLLKKITNLKVRAKAALNRGVALSPWQSKILDIIKDDTAGQSDLTKSGREDESSGITNNANEEQSNICQGVENVRGDTEIVVEVVDCGDTQTFMDQFETEHTRNLTNEQLQRIVLLQQIKVLELQKRKLENDVSGVNPIMFDISGLNVSSILNSNDQ